MERIEKYILMYKNDEVLSFSVTFAKRNDVQIIDKLEHFNEAPYGVKEAKDIKERNDALFRFFNARAIPGTRPGYKKILRALKCADGFELSFKGHGLSLSNHYWYKKESENLRYEDINFFTNKWDDTFGRALINEDYKTLKKADINVPDIVTSGWALKGWIYDDGPKLYKLGIAEDHSEESISEVLVSRLATRLFDNENEILKYELKKLDNGRYASVSKAMIGIDEELVPLSIILPHNLYELYINRNHDRKFTELFFEKIKDTDYPELSTFFVKIMCLRSLAFLSDLHFDNVSMIRDSATGKLRLAPLFDLAGGFGSTERGRTYLSNLDKGGLMIIYFVFGNLDQTWNYSWYDASRLEGFEEEIREYLSKSDFYTTDLINSIIYVFKQQKATLDTLALKQKQ